VRFDPRFDAGLMLKGAQRREQIGRGRISAWAHHPHQALLGDVGLPAQRAEADGGVDAIAQEDEAGRDFAFEERLQRLGEKGGFEGGLRLARATTLSRKSLVRAMVFS
jgi:hypothetical protein